MMAKPMGSDIPLSVCSSEVQGNMQRCRVPLDPELDVLWEQINTHRVEIRNLRSEIHAIRVELRERQIAKPTADDLLFEKMVRRSLDSGVQHSQLGNPDGSIELKSVEELMEDCQLARDKYGPLEDECNDLEDSLSREEFRLVKMESEFYESKLKRSFQSQRQFPVTLFESDSLEFQTPFSWTQLESDTVPEYLPLVEEYLPNLGDLDISREKIEKYEYDEVLGWRSYVRSLEDLLRIQNATAILAKFSSQYFFKTPIDEDKQPTNFGNRKKPGLEMNLWERQEKTLSHMPVNLIEHEKDDLCIRTYEWKLDGIRKEETKGAANSTTYPLNIFRVARSCPAIRALASLTTAAYLLSKLPTVDAIVIDIPSFQDSIIHILSSDPLFLNTILAIALSFIYFLIVFFDSLWLPMIIVSIGSFFVGMDDTISNCQLIFICCFSGSLILAFLKSKLTSLPRSGALTALVITILGISSSNSITYLLHVKQAYNFQGRYTDPWILGAITALPLTTLFTLIWNAAFFQTGLARSLEEGRYNESIIGVSREVSWELFVLFVGKIPGLEGFGRGNNAWGERRPQYPRTTVHEQYNYAPREFDEEAATDPGMNY